MTSMLEFFSCTIDIALSAVGLPNGVQTHAIKEGIVILSPGLLMKHVLYVPGLSINLILVEKLIVDSNCDVCFSGDLCCLGPHFKESSWPG